MKEQLIIMPLLINLLMFIVGMVFGIDPNLITNEITISAPGGYVFLINLGAIIFGLIAAAIALSFIGIKILGSGLSETSVSIINRAVIYFMTWTILSTLTLSFLALIPTFGYIIYAILSILYGFGVYLSLGEVGVGSTDSTSKGGEE